MTFDILSTMPAKNLATASPNLRALIDSDLRLFSPVYGRHIRGDLNWMRGSVAMTVVRVPAFLFT
jgi:hypothetical protein